MKTLLVSDRSIPVKLKTALLVAVVPFLAVLRAAGVDWGSIDDTERLAREAALTALITSAVILSFSLYAHFRKTTIGEPVAVAGSIAAMISAVFIALFAFDAADEGVITALYGLVVAVGSVFGITVTRDQVRPETSVMNNPNVEPQDAFYGESERGAITVIEVAALAVIIVAIVWLIQNI